MKVLTVCQAGTVRSGSAALFCKQVGHPDTIQCGMQSNSAETLALLGRWADRILVAEGYMRDAFPSEIQSKIIDLEIGPDQWGVPLHPDLMNKIANQVISKGALQ